MKKILSAIIAAAMFAFTGCEQFATSYQRIDDSEFRVLDFMFEPADAAPGDTVTLVAVFAGKKADLDSYIKWEISLNVIVDMFGAMTVVDSVPIEKYARRFDTTFSENTQAVGFRIALPDDVIRKSASIPDVWTDAFLPSVTAQIPDELKSMTKNQIIDAIEILCTDYNVTPPPALRNYLPVMLQLFTVPIRITAKINEPGRLPHTIRTGTGLTVRYNSKLRRDGGIYVPVNRNPVIDDVIIYKVKGENISNIDNKSGLEYLRYRCGDYAPISVEKGYSYFLDVEESYQSFDFTTTMGGSRIEEKHYIYRQFQLRKDQTAGVRHTKFLSIDNSNGKITMPGDRKIEDVIFWVTVKDEAVNERMRPEGSTLKEISVRLVYK